jgi:hypothetical protein
MMGIEAVIAELALLIADGVISGYAIGGAVAAFQYIEPGFTEDLDVFVVCRGAEASTLAPLGPLWAALVSRGYAVDNMYLVIGGWRVQFLLPASNLYDEAIAHARDIPFGHVVGKVMSPEYLAAIALDAGRNKDFVRVEEFLSRKVVDRAALLALVERYGLAERWKTFETRFLGTNV